MEMFVGMHRSPFPEGCCDLLFLLSPLQVGASAVRTGLKISISKVYFHCGKAMVRSRLWDEGSKLPPGTLPSFGEVVKAEAELAQSTEEMDEMMEDMYQNRLY